MCVFLLMLSKVEVHIWGGNVTMAEYLSPLLIGCSGDLCLLMETGTVVSGCL